MCNIALILFLKCDVTEFRIPLLSHNVKICRPPLPPLMCDVIYGCALTWYNYIVTFSILVEIPSSDYVIVLVAEFIHTSTTLWSLCSAGRLSSKVKCFDSVCHNQFCRLSSCTLFLICCCKNKRTFIKDSIEISAKKTIFPYRFSSK